MSLEQSVPSFRKSQANNKAEFIMEAFALPKGDSQILIKEFETPAIKTPPPVDCVTQVQTKNLITRIKDLFRCNRSL